MCYPECTMMSSCRGCDNMQNKRFPERIQLPLYRLTDQHMQETVTSEHCWLTATWSVHRAGTGLSHQGHWTAQSSLSTQHGTFWESESATVQLESGWEARVCWLSFSLKEQKKNNYHSNAAIHLWSVRSSSHIGFYQQSWLVTEAILLPRLPTNNSFYCNIKIVFFKLTFQIVLLIVNTNYFKIWINLT